VFRRSLILLSNNCSNTSGLIILNLPIRSSEVQHRTKKPPAFNVLSFANSKHPRIIGESEQQSNQTRALHHPRWPSHWCPIPAWPLQPHSCSGTKANFPPWPHSQFSKGRRLWPFETLRPLSTATPIPLTSANSIARANPVEKLHFARHHSTTTTASTIDTHECYLPTFITPISFANPLLDCYHSSRNLQSHSRHRSLHSQCDSRKPF
jgi:hypothetical protein